MSRKAPPGSTFNMSRRRASAKELVRGPADLPYSLVTRRVPELGPAVPATQSFAAAMATPSS